jgi:hypothetical protein
MRSLTKTELITVAGAGMTATTITPADMAAKKAAIIAAIKAKLAAIKAKHATMPHPVCVPTTTPTTPTTEETAA